MLQAVEIIADELILRHGCREARSRALAISNATGMYGSIECAGLYELIARQIESRSLEQCARSQCG